MLRRNIGIARERRGRWRRGWRGSAGGAGGAGRASAYIAPIPKRLVYSKTPTSGGAVSGVRIEKASRVTLASGGQLSAAAVVAPTVQ
ncbi:hypothetical protein EVAR_49782_1 [Eumeta japonica]|uniref:Uncharacterized protein n=1 Tax=Eumeta variegata TaxID=151549 RepID=A0A4C1Y5M5_EUMVA|nr:hypothetical protein EVAR_49782_1 [Eumeta japonica]